MEPLSSSSSSSPPDAASMQKRIAELEATNAHLNQLGLTVQGRLARAEEQLVAARASAQPVTVVSSPSSSSYSSHVSRPKIPAPRTFGGETGAAVDEWIDDMVKQFSFYNAHFHSDAVKIDHAMMFVVTKVTNWYKASAEDRRAAGHTIVTWDQFAAAMRERYQPVASSMAARSSLDRITQSGSVQSYTQYFYTCMTYISDMSQADQVHQYTRGLKSVIRSDVHKQKCKSLSEAVNAAVAAEAYLPNGAGQASSSHTYRPSMRPSPNMVGGAGSSAPMDINSVTAGTSCDRGGNSVTAGSEVEFATDAGSSREDSLLAMIQSLQAQMQVQQQVNALFGRTGQGAASGSSSTNRVPGVTKEDYARCRAEGLCLNCKEKGHNAASCTKPRRLKW